MLQSVAVTTTLDVVPCCTCCSALQCVAVPICVLVFCSVVQCGDSVVQCGAVWCSVVRCGAVCCSMLQCCAVCCSVVQFVSVCCSVLQCVAVCCSTLHSGHKTSTGGRTLTGFSCRSFSTKEPLITGLFCGK